MATEPKYFFIRHIQTPYSGLLTYDDTYAEWQHVSTITLYEHFFDATAISRKFIGLVEYFINLKRIAVADLKGETACCICNELLSDSDHPAPAERPVKVHCGHIFGERCLAQWLWTFHGQSHACPICRGPIWFTLGSSLQELNLSSPNLLRQTTDVEENADPDDAYGRVVQIWARTIRLLKQVQDKVMAFASLRKHPLLKSWVGPPWTAQEMNISEVVTICCRYSLEHELFEDIEFKVDNGRGIIIRVDKKMRISWADDATPEQILRKQRRELTESLSTSA